MQPVRTENATSSNGCKILTNIINTMVRDSNQKENKWQNLATNAPIK